MSLLTNHRYIQTHPYRNMLGIPSISVTITYNITLVDKLINGGIAKERKFCKSEGTPWMEKIGSGYQEVKNVESVLLLTEYCGHIGQQVPHD